MTDHPQNLFSHAAVIDRFEGMTAVLQMEGGFEVRWPVKRLPDDAKAGTAVRLTLSTASSDEAARVQIARTMLNDLLHTPNRHTRFMGAVVCDEAGWLQDY